MPTYHYRCNNCEFEFKTQQSIKAEVLKECPECECESIERVLYAASCFVRQDPKTLGHQAARNTEQMGKYELQEKRADLASRSKAGKKAMGIEEVKPPWWRRTKQVNTKLATASDKEKKDYIFKGVTPS